MMSSVASPQVPPMRAPGQAPKTCAVNLKEMLESLKAKVSIEKHLEIDLLYLQFQSQQLTREALLQALLRIAGKDLLIESAQRATKRPRTSASHSGTAAVSASTATTSAATPPTSSIALSPSTVASPSTVVGSSAGSSPGTPSNPVTVSLIPATATNVQSMQIPFSPASLVRSASAQIPQTNPASPSVSSPAPAVQMVCAMPSPAAVRLTPQTPADIYQDVLPTSSVPPTIHGAAFLQYADALASMVDGDHGLMCSKSMAELDLIEAALNSAVAALSTVKVEKRLEEALRERGVKKDTDERLLCKICQENEVHILLMPCKHLALCQSCSFMVSECPLCRGQITEMTEVFL